MDLIVSRENDQWRARAGTRSWRCAIGAGGLRPEAEKREGDGATPLGCYALRRLVYRADRIAKPETRLPVAALSPEDAWCDAPEDPAYNRPVRLPYGASHERLWRDDGIYDVIAMLGYNDDPPVAGLGSAIFLHVARADYAPTQGCVALALPDLLNFLRDADTRSRVCVEAG
jgi:L,D-peptidoglycan transpeptidase YkuD (ErfK/YbiS/YcfS/YnhG family)